MAYSVKKNFSDVLSNTTLGKTHRVISAFRRGRTLKDFLVKARLSSKPLKVRGFGIPKAVRNYQTGSTYVLREYLPLYLKNCVYLISCKKCSVQYVGGNSGIILEEPFFSPGGCEEWY